MRALLVLLLAGGAASAQERVLQGETGGVRGVAVSPDGKLVAGGGEMGIAVWELAGGKPVATLFIDRDGRKPEMRSENIEALAFSPDGRVLASGGIIVGLSLWEPRGKKLLGRADQQQLRAIAFAPDGKVVASAGDRGVDLWDAATAKSRAHWVPVAMYRAARIAYTPDGKLLVVGITDHTVRLLDATTGKELGHHDGYREGGLAVSADGKLLAAERQLLTLPDLGDAGDLPDLSTSILAEAFSPDGKWLATAHDDGAVRLWNVSTRKLRQLLGSHEGNAESVVFTPDGKLVVSGGSDRKVRVFETP